jgi:transglutaminase-like putative cysteine protease
MGQDLRRVDDSIQGHYFDLLGLSEARMRLPWAVAIGIGQVLMWPLAIVVPIFGVWLCSSLVAYSNGPALLAAASAILLSPLLPILWEGVVRRTEGLPAWGTADSGLAASRLVLRSLALNLTFVLLLLLLQPKTAFMALATRGDWMLGPDGSESVREAFFSGADRFEWLYGIAHRNPHQGDPSLKRSKTQPSPQASGIVATANAPFDPEAQPPQVADPSQPGKSKPRKPKPGQPGKPIARLIPGGRSPQFEPQFQGNHWPWPKQVPHPAIVDMPRKAEANIASVAQYLAAQEPDPILRIKALHDYVADRLTYDTESPEGKAPPQDAAAVFKRRTALAGGYANLLSALGQAIGIEIPTISGNSRIPQSDLDGTAHAWNAVRLQNQWQLIDVTWDSVYLEGRNALKRYRTDYLFPPASLFAYSHFPDDAAWQLLDEPIDRGEFLRQPILSPAFFAQDLALVAPQRSVTDLASPKGDAIVTLENPRKRWLQLGYSSQNTWRVQLCGSPQTDGSLQCKLPQTGIYNLHILVGDDRRGLLQDVAQVWMSYR